MKTWFNTWPVFLIAIIPVTAFFIPSVFLKGKYFGGGIFREWLTNLTISLSPEESANYIANVFNNGDISAEYFTALPAFLLIMLLVIWHCYLVGELQIRVINSLHRNSQKSLRKAIKG